MPRPQRRKTSRTYAYTVDTIIAALDEEAWIAFWGGEHEARAAWQALAPVWRSHPGDRPAPFWAFTPKVPEELRRLPDSWDPRVSDGPDPAEDVEVGRMKWLLGPGKAHLRPGEPEAIYERLGTWPPKHWLRPT